MIQITGPDGVARITTVRAVLGRIATILGVSTDDLRGSYQGRGIVDARHAAMWAIRKSTNASLPQIGRDLGGKHHTTVLHAIRKAEAALSQETKAELLAAAKGEN